MKTTLTLLSAALMMGALAGGAHAAPTLCSAPGAHPDGLSVSDMTFQTKNANDCYGVVEGNDNATNIWTDTGWTLFAKDNTPGSDTGGTILGITFVLDATPEGGATSGSWTLSWTQTGLPGYDLTMDVVGVLKAGNQFASYLFEDLKFTSNDSGAGTWEIAYTFTNKKNKEITQDLSHLSLYYKNAVHSSSSSSNSSGPASSSTNGSQVSEPGMLGLIGLGLLGQAFLLRQRRRRLEK